MALTLIDKQDNIEIVRDQIAAILVTEITNQKALAVAALKNENDWSLNVYTERANPWEQWLNNQVDKSPIVNVWMDTANYDRSASNAMERQKAEAVFNIDCYGYGESSDVPLGGHVAGDNDAALQSQKALRLVRNILMSAENTYLQLRGLVWDRWPQSIAVFQPQSVSSVQQIVGSRLALNVSFNEFAPQVTFDTLDYIAIDVIRTEDGQIVLEADYQFPLP